MKRWLCGLTLFLASTPVWAQTESRDSPLMAVLFTWAPVLVLVGFWLFFMRKIGWTSKAGGYREYMRVSQEKLALIEGHLAEIASSLKTIAEKERGRD